MPQINLGRIGFVNKGDWADGLHKINDVVKYNNIIYVCTTPHTSTAGNILPTNGSYWEKWLDGSEWYTKTDIDNKQTGFKNYIINGGFDVWQRGTSLTVTPYTIQYIADRFFSYSAPGGRISKSTDAPIGFGNSFKFTKVTGKNDYFGTKLENNGQYYGKELTLSFYAKGTLPKIRYIRIGGDGTNVFVLGKQEITSSWTRYSVTLTTSQTTALFKSKTSTSSLGIMFYMDSEDSGDLYITGVQLEEGSVATPFEQRPYGLELSLCQRYYETGFFAVSPTTIGTGAVLATNIVYKNVKRVTPTVAYHSVTYTGCSSITTNLNTTTLTSPQLIVSTSGHAFATGVYTASSEL